MSTQRRCVDIPRGLPAQPRAALRLLVHLGAAIVLPLLLAACGSTPSLPPLEQYPQPGSGTPAPTAGTQSTAPASQPQQPSAATTSPAPEPSKPSRFSRRSDVPKDVQDPKSEPEQARPAPMAPLALGSDVVSPVAQQQFDAAVALAQSGDVAAAERAFDTLNAQYPDYAGPLVNLGILRAKAGKLETAEQALVAATERNPSNAMAFNHLGIVYRRLGRFKDAEKAYQRAVEIDPNYANAYLNLGVLCDLYLQQPQRALEAFERYTSLVSQPDAKVTAWINEIKARVGAGRSARSEQ
jgi:Tetratricopeptide repeat